MKNFLILGAGTAGTMMANKLRKELSIDEWNITIVDQFKTHYYQPGFLFIPFGIYKKEDVIKPKSDFLPIGVNVVYSKIDKIVPEENKVLLDEGQVLKYDYLLIATGTKTSPEEVEGLKGSQWNKSVFDFYTIEGSVALAEFFKSWKGGKLVVNVAELPYKCPVAPLEFVFLADAFFTERGMRDKVDITLATPLPGAFTKPKATKLLGGLLEEKNIKIIPDYNISSLDNEKKTIVDYGGTEIPFDVLVTVPTNKGDDMIERSGMGDDLNFIPTDKHTLKAENYDNIFVLGDASNIPTSKAGSVAHFAGEILMENILCEIEGRPMTASFDGHANCYIVTGHGKGTLIDFNYTTEPLPGNFPMPGIGPFGLLQITRMNYYGKMLFRWIYWHVLLKGKEMPISANMTMAGKKL
ncbi:MAG: oxidoreductase [Bacteroidetes bacterium GWA2_31_9]|nr:MAG: oxidoreductase [Bacteroidetes bacterium GWA2_31_9]